MANSKFDSKSFNAEAFKYMVDRVPNLNLNELKKSRALAGNPDIRGVFTAQNGTAYARLAMRGLIDGDAVNYDGQTDITATSTKTFEQGVVSSAVRRLGLRGTSPMTSPAVLTSWATSASRWPSIRTIWTRTRFSLFSPAFSP